MGFDVNIPDDFLEGLLKTDFEEIAKEAAEECAPILKESMQKQLSQVIQHEGGSDLVNSIKISKPKRTKTDGYIVNVGPSGSSDTYYYAHGKKKRKYRVSNVLKAIWLEYGRRGQAARPWLATSTKNVQAQILKKMQDIYNSKVK